MSATIISNDIIQLENGDYEYFEEVLIPSEEQEHFIIKGKEIIGDYENVIVTGDKSSNKLWFTMRDSFDGEPLHDKTFKIWFSTPDGFVDSDEPAEIIHNEDKEQIRFCWQLEAKHSRVEGKITFALEITDDTGYEWNTKEAELTVEKGFIKNGTVPPIERGWVNQCITDSAEAITLAKATASQTANLTAKVNSIFASFAVSDYIKGITVGMVISPLFPVKFNTWSVHRGETELASGLNPTAAFITPSAIFKQQDDETITVKFHTDKITIVTELEIVNQYDTSIWGVLEFTEFVSN